MLKDDVLALKYAQICPFVYDGVLRDIEVGIELRLQLV
jgi:hypothetical protein